MKVSSFIFYFTLLFAACTRTEIPHEVLQLTEDRMALYYIQQDSICKQKAYQKAEAAVDSFFLNIRQQYLHDSIDVPLKPIKPMVDTNIVLDQTNPVKPLWDSLKIK